MFWFTPFAGESMRERNLGARKPREEQGKRELSHAHGGGTLWEGDDIYVGTGAADVMYLGLSGFVPVPTEAIPFFGLPTPDVADTSEPGCESETKSLPPRSLYFSNFISTCVHRFEGSVNCGPSMWRSASYGKSAESSKERQPSIIPRSRRPS
mmetsp:Transcript_15277/g.39328  ORF Transcript_15277/g.39328 Transcript_15277/m.39328 type:complete len:153 (-) Transcript_15277:736-1194(-)